MSKTEKKNLAAPTALYSLKVAKKGTEQLPLILQFTNYDVYFDTYLEIHFHRPDLEVLEKSEGTMLYQSKKDAIDIIDTFLR